MHLRIVLPLVLGLAFMGAAGASAAAPDPCKLVTPDDLSKALGGPAKFPSGHGRDDTEMGHECQYGSGPPTPLEYVIKITERRTPLEARAYYRGLAYTMTQGPGAEKPSPLKGVGRVAMTFSNDAASYKGRYVVESLVKSQTGNDNVANAKLAARLLKVAVDRIKP